MSQDSSEKDKYYYPSKEIIKHAYVKEYETLYRKSIEDREGFWAEEAKKLNW